MITEHTESTIVAVARQIREELHGDYLRHEWSDLITPDEPDYEHKKLPEFHRGYMALKCAVAEVIRPKRICEIGVCTGLSAMAFLHAVPDAFYCGVDNASMGAENLKVAEKRFRERGFWFRLHYKNTNHLYELPDTNEGLFDLVHVDGGHERPTAKHDTLLAWHATHSKAFILVDDCRDRNVCLGVFDALAELTLDRELEWAYFEDSWNGNILISKEHNTKRVTR